jgi:D-arabinose 1-dehydrogenase-like Zn-dependent alcohol dehydrogenase
LVKVNTAGVNPIDYITVTNATGIKPPPLTPGAEVTGRISEAGEHLTALKKGDKLVLYNRLIYGTYDMCINGYEMLCRNGGIIGVNTNGGFAEYIVVSKKCS